MASAEGAVTARRSHSLSWARSAEPVTAARTAAPTASFRAASTSKTASRASLSCPFSNALAVVLPRELALVLVRPALHEVLEGRARRLAQRHEDEVSVELGPVLIKARRRRERRLRDGHAHRLMPMNAPLKLVGIDLTRVMILGLFPVWLVGIVDYHGSKLIALERLWWPTAAEVCRVIERAIEKHGTPARVLSDNGGQFRSLAFEMLLVRRGVEHTFTRPNHPWTNGRIERLFRTFKETIFNGRWMLLDVEQLDRYCKHFITFYNRDRPHSAYGGRTPDEVYFKRNFHRALEPVTYFDGALR